MKRRAALGLLAIALLCACPFDTSLREYLSAQFWLPFSKHARDFERPHVRRISAPFAGMIKPSGMSPLEKLRAIYQRTIGVFPTGKSTADLGTPNQAIADALADKSLTAKQREEVSLIEAKIELRGAERGDSRLLQSARTKLQSFLRTARTPEFRSEARGWLARTYYLAGDQTAAGKIYLDELNRNGSNLSRATLFTSLRMTYGYDGGGQLVDHLGEYFDTPEHAAFAIELLTNPHWQDASHEVSNQRMAHFTRDAALQWYPRVKTLLEEHAGLLHSERLPLLAMRTALRMGDPAGARKLAARIPANAAVRSDPDFQWMDASAHFLSRDYAAAEAPLLALFRSSNATLDQKAAAAYGLCGVYWKTGDPFEQLRFALWLHAHGRMDEQYSGVPQISDLTVYWAFSGWDLGMLLDAEAPLETLAEFVTRNPAVANVRLVKYSLAVRLARENRYEESAAAYESVGAMVRAARMRRMAELYRAAYREDLPESEQQETRYKLAEFISVNPERIYFNDRLWGGYQRYTFQASSDSRFTGAEREKLLALERKLKDDQEERWRAYLVLRDVARDAGQAELRVRAARLAIGCLNGLSERFGREADIRRAGMELAAWVRR